ncbi:MAG TPA: Ku protein [Solirubrobacteraceae bacterium]
MLGPLDGAPIEVHRYCSKENVEVPYEEITHGYECEDGEQVIVADLELEAIEPRKTRTIDIEQFVDLENVIRSTRARRSRAQDGQGAPTGGRI